MQGRFNCAQIGDIVCNASSLSMLARATNSYCGLVGHGCHFIHVAVLWLCCGPDQRFADVHMSRSAICCGALCHEVCLN